ncbi:MAG TPA: sigma-70 family RNA polymerase sigma factor [Pirellulaceae bacterium]|jgi:RNA polymerase sigma factor (TIGR02999 family)
MSEVTRLLVAISGGDPQATTELLPVVYQELRRLARAKMAQERGEHTLQATALVHEAYLRLVGPADSESPQWDSRGHFFAAAAEAMRRILIEHARGKNAIKRGGEYFQVDLDDACRQIAMPSGDFNDLLALNDALTKLTAEAPAKAELVKLRYFAGLSLEESAAALKISPATAKRHWAFARAFLFNELTPRKSS